MHAESGRHRRDLELPAPSRRSGSGWRSATTSRRRSTRTSRASPDSDTNIKDGSDPAAADYIGKHAGTAFLELQFYPPGWAPWPPGVSCDAHKWCAAMAIFSLNNDYNHGDPEQRRLPEHGRHRAGQLRVRHALGDSSRAAEPARRQPTTRSRRTRRRDLFMNGGDKLVVDIHDSSAGLVTVIHDRTTASDRVDDRERRERVRAGQLRARTRRTCSQSPYAFHPMYSTSSEHTRVPWAAHSYNVAFSDEIGHFEYCDDVSPKAATVATGDGRRRRRRRASARLTRCSSRSGAASPPTTTSTGRSYQPVWPGTNPSHGQDTKYHAEPVTFTSPVFNGSAELQPGRVRGRPAADRGGRLRRQLQPDDGRELRQPAAGSATSIRSIRRDEEHGHELLLAARRHASPGHDEHVRWQLDRRVRAAPAERLPGHRLRASVPVQQLQADPEQQPLPNRAARGPRDAPLCAASD